MRNETKNLFGWMMLSAFYAAGRKQYAVYCIWMAVVIVNSIIFAIFPSLVSPAMTIIFMMVGWAVAYALHRREMRTGTFGSIVTNWWRVMGALVIYVMIITVPITFMVNRM